MKCPQCSSTMQGIEYEGVPIQTCESCGGEFIGGAELAHVVRTRQEQFDVELKDMLAQRKPIFGVPQPQTKRLHCCPGCGEPMNVLNYGADSGIYVDRCEGCDSLWLDHQELEKIQALMERRTDEAPQQLQAIADKLELARREAAQSTADAFAGSRFAFVNALINRLLDAA
ncbi:MAG: zf-TFIIB domain-containing protein [Planctomycetota bacterium]|nr:zf-TFIIB domain-containing protein [Planctomycetota bacterium]